MIVPITVEIVNATNNDNATMNDTWRASVIINASSPAIIGFCVMNKKANTPTKESEVQAVSGATISSKSIVDAVNIAINLFNKMEV